MIQDVKDQVTCQCGAAGMRLSQFLFVAHNVCGCVGPASVEPFFTRSPGSSETHRLPGTCFPMEEKCSLVRAFKLSGRYEHCLELWTPYHVLWAGTLSVSYFKYLWHTMVQFHSSCLHFRMHLDWPLIWAGRSPGLAVFRTAALWLFWTLKLQFHNYGS